MQIWAEVFGADESTSYGRVNIALCTVTRSLDSAGVIVLEVPAADAVAVRALRIGRWVKVYANPDEKRLIGEGLLQMRRVGVGGQDSVTWQAADRLELLRRKNTWRGLIYDDWPIADVLVDLCELAGWGCVVADSVTGVTSWRFDGVSVLEAVAAVCQAHGLHFRLGQAGNVLEVGYFGDSSGVVFSHLGQLDAASRPAVVLIESLTVTHEGNEIVNVIEPIAGPVDGGMTLKHSNRTSPLPVHTIVTGGGKRGYVLRDEESIATYGEIEAVVAPLQLFVPLNVSKRGRINMANVLYEWGVAYLKRNSIPQTTYDISGVNVPSLLKAGDTARVRYLGTAWVEGAQARYIDVDEMLWVLSVTTRWNLQGAAISLSVSNVDKQPVSAVEMIALAIETTTVKAKGPVGSYERNKFEANSQATGVSTGAVLDFEIEATTVDIISARFTVTTRLIASSTAGFTYKIFVYVDGYGAGEYFISTNLCDTNVIELQDILLGLPELQGAHQIEVFCQYTGQADMTLELIEFILPGSEAVLGTGRLCT